LTIFISQLLFRGGRCGHQLHELEHCQALDNSFKLNGHVQKAFANNRRQADSMGVSNTYKEMSWRGVTEFSLFNL